MYMILDYEGGGGGGGGGEHTWRFRSKLEPDQKGKKYILLQLTM